jgi:hypothetical protein
MNTDSFFSIGRSHQVCQDYALSGMTNNLPYVIVSDGCSSSKDTDFGSRILSKCLEGCILEPYEDDSLVKLKNTGFDLCRAYTKSLCVLDNFHELTDNCLDATLLLAKQTGKEIQVFATGDGVIAAKHKNGTIVVKVIEFEDNAPVYLSYKYNPKRKEQLHKMYDCTKTITTHFIGKEPSFIQEISTNEEMEIFVFPMAEYTHVSIMTDGILSFQKIIEDNTSRSTESVSIENLIPDLMAYKGEAGSFVQRRTQKFMKSCSENKMYHDDDFSIGTISI